MFWTTHQNVPNIFIRFFKAAEAHADPYEPAAAPQAAGHHGGLPDAQRLAAVQQHLHGLFHVPVQQLVQGVVVPVLEKENIPSVSTPGRTGVLRSLWPRLQSSYQPGVADRDDEVVEGLQPCLVPRGVLLHLRKTGGRMQGFTWQRKMATITVLMAQMYHLQAENVKKTHPHDV